MSRSFRSLLAGTVVFVVLATSCASPPSRSGLVKKLKQENGLTTSQAECVADGLYDGVAKSPTHAGIRPLTTRELRAVAKPDNAGKVPADVVQVLRDVVSVCLPTNVQPVVS